MRRRMLIPLAAPPETVARELVGAFGFAPATPAGGEPNAGVRSFTAGPGERGANVELAAEVRKRAGGGTDVLLEASSDLTVPYFGWFVAALTWIAARSMLRDTAARLEAATTGEVPRPPRRLPKALPPVAFTEEQAGRLAALAAAAVLASFCGALLTQNSDAVTHAFHKSDQDLGAALAIARAGVLVSLVVSLLSDRLGRRRLVLASLAGACIANAVAAASPSFEVFTASQLLSRAFVNAVLVVAGVAVVEEAPEGARAFATSMFALAYGGGVVISVVLLPLSDIGNDGWRVSFAASALAALTIPGLARHVRETRRYDRLAERTDERGRFREIFDRRYGRRFLLLGLAAFLTNLFSAPSSQLTNRYLRRSHGYTNSDVAVFRSVTAGVPGLVGVLLAGRLAESRGRRPVTIAGIGLATLLQATFFLGGGIVLWIAPTFAIVAAACGGLALATLDGELFPTEVRGSSNGFLLVCAVSGSAAGLLLATHLEGVAGGLGPGVALCGIAPLLATFLVVPRLPETVDRRLDDVSPSEV
ncbi:MAG TPA: MFS transporter [Acidimicrobiia bacterium]|nr:MFS transporter [Acidimicrobiia bacterium]